MTSAILAAMLQGTGDPKPASRRWTTANKALGVAALLGLAGDWLTTVDLARREEEGHREMNPILGSRPSVGAVNSYMGAATAGLGLLAHLLPPKKRNLFLGGVAGVEIANALRNRHLGLRFNLHF